MTKKSEYEDSPDKFDDDCSVSVEKEFILKPNELFRNVIPKYRDSVEELKKTFRIEE